MNWSTCYTRERYGYSTEQRGFSRTDYQRDYDRLIFSTAFRRLQNKTQVFPLPGSRNFVHNRLTHSLETASVGRSIASIVGQEIAHLIEDKASKEFYLYNLSEVVAAGCIAHDVGNPAFGHSGEKAISAYFIENHDEKIGGSTLRALFSDEEWCDVTNFEGNANALRILTHHYEGKLAGGMNLTYTTLASILKYPCSSSATDKKALHTKKYGYFQDDKETFVAIAEKLGMIRASEDPLVYHRHPFVFLVEAADDICYRIIDWEDAHRIGILQRKDVEEKLLQLLKEMGGQDEIVKISSRLEELTDDNEAMAYLRAKTINGLVQRCARVFLDNQEKILAGTFEYSLMDLATADLPSINSIARVSVDKIYNHPSVVEVEIAGYRVMSGLLEIFIPAILSDRPTTIMKKTKTLIPTQYIKSSASSPYERVMGIVDFIAGMTDDYAMDLYRTCMGIEIGR